MDRLVRVLYFVEDRAQEGFIRALVDRIATEESFPPGNLEHNVRSSRGSRVIQEFREFVSDIREGLQNEPDVMVVAVDGNCRGYHAKVRELARCFEPSHQLKERTAYAVPDPHIERWYLADQGAFKEAVGGTPPPLPRYKCKRDYYKSLLSRALRDAGVRPLLGGPEYGERIADNADLNALSRQNAGLGMFLQDLRRILRGLKPQL